MTAVNVCLRFLFIVIAFTEVACWTYDLEEVKKFYDEQQKKEEYWKEHAETEIKDERLVENSTYNYESVYGDNYSHGGHVTDDIHHEYGRNGNYYHNQGRDENGDFYHDQGSHEDSYHDHGSHKHSDYTSHHGGHGYRSSHKGHSNLNHGDSHQSYGRPKHMGSYHDHGPHQEYSNYNQLKPYKGETRKYASGYGYESYMGLKLHGIMHNGTRYLEGLRLAVENFKRMVENCTTANATVFPGFRYNGTAPAMELFNSSSVQGLDSNMRWSQIFNMTAAMMGLNTSNPVQRARDAIPGTQRFDTSRCANATKDREHIRRLADLAMHTVRQLQDLAMKHHKDHKHEEIELLVRLAWFLDRIAHITGFDPDADRFAPTEAGQQATTTVPQNPLALNVSDAVKQQLMDCVHQNSSTPATLRCNIPVDMPPIMRMTFNIPENNNGVSPVLSNPAPEPASGMSPTNPAMSTIIGSPIPVGDNPMSNPQQIPGSSPELPPGSLGGIPVENQMLNMPPFSGTPDLPPLSVIGLNPSGSPPLDAVQSAAKQMSNLAPFSRAVRSIRKRSIDNPMLKVIKYYAKHKVWTGSNMKSGETTDKDDLSVDNGISTPKSVQKRSSGNTMHKFIDTKRDRSTNIRYKRFDEYKKASRSMQKRSSKYQDWVVSRQSEDPQQDISYYIKNKPGTNIMPSLVGVAQARLALERIFQTGNIEVVRRYGANYNPAIPSPFYFGLVKTLSDI